MRKKILVLVLILMMLFAVACKEERVALETVTIKPYEREVYETTTVMQGNVVPELNLQLSPVEKQSVSYTPPESEMEVNKVYVKAGDFVKDGDLLVSFKSGEIEKKLTEYRDELKMQELLIEHYEKLMLTDLELDYQEDIDLLRNDMIITKLYIAEESAKLEEYNIRAEGDGVVDSVSELMSMGKVNKSDCIVTVVYNTGVYESVVQDDFLFETGSIYPATSNSAVYNMELLSIEEVSDKSKKLTFKALDVNAVTRVAFLNLNITKEDLTDALYVEKKAVIEVEGKHYIFKVNEEGFKEGIEVEIGDVIDNYIVIKSGAEAGDRVVLN